MGLFSRTSTPKKNPPETSFRHRVTVYQDKKDVRHVLRLHLEGDHVDFLIEELERLRPRLTEAEEGNDDDDDELTIRGTEALPNGMPIEPILYTRLIDTIGSLVGDRINPASPPGEIDLPFVLGYVSGLSPSPVLSGTNPDRRYTYSISIYHTSAAAAVTIADATIDALHDWVDAEQGIEWSHLSDAAMIPEDWGYQYSLTFTINVGTVVEA